MNASTSWTAGSGQLVPNTTFTQDKLVPKTISKTTRAQDN